MAKARDPICGMKVDESSAIRLTVAGKDYFFCSQHCQEKFIQQQRPKEAQVCYPSKRIPLLKNPLFLVCGITIIMIVASFFIPPLVPLRHSFLGYLTNIWWAVVLGLFLGGIIDYYVPQEYVSYILARRSGKTILNAVFLGFLMSACSHGILALSIQLHKKGASGPAVISFLLASPWANFTITMMLLSLFGLRGLFIIIAAVIVAINTGFIYMFLEKKGWIEKNKNTVELKEEFSILQDIKRRAKGYRFNLKTDTLGILKGSLALSNMVLWWIILGMLIASIAGAYIPVHVFHRYMGPTVWGLLVTLVLATVIEVCSEGSSPLAFEIYNKTSALGNSFVFLMAGVATDYTEIGLLWTNVGRRTALWLPLVSLPQIILLGYLTNLFLG